MAKQISPPNTQYSYHLFCARVEICDELCDHIVFATSRQEYDALVQLLQKIEQDLVDMIFNIQ